MKHHFDKLTVMDDTVYINFYKQPILCLVCYSWWNCGTIVEHLMPEYDPESTPSQMIWEVIGQCPYRCFYLLCQKVS